MLSAHLNIVQDAIRSFTAALGRVAPFTWLEQATQDALPEPESEPDYLSSVADQARSLAKDASRATSDALHRWQLAAVCTSHVLSHHQCGAGQA